MEVLSCSVYGATPAAVGGAIPSLGAAAKIFQALGRLPCRPDCCWQLVQVAPYTGGAANTRAVGLAEEHTEVTLGFLKKVDDTEYSRYI